jgi:hypothetical protein
MKRINVMLDSDINLKAVRKSTDKLGITSLSALIRYLLKRFLNAK